MAWKCPPMFPNHIGRGGCGGGCTDVEESGPWILGQGRPPASEAMPRTARRAGPACLLPPLAARSPVAPPPLLPQSSPAPSSSLVQSEKDSGGSCPVPATPQSLLLPPAPSTATAPVGPRERAASTGLLSPPPGPAPTASGSLGPCQVSSPLARSPQCSPTAQAPYLAACPPPAWPWLLFPPGAGASALLLCPQQCASVCLWPACVCVCAALCQCESVFWLCRPPGSLSISGCLSDSAWLGTGPAGRGRWGDH